MEVMHDAAAPAAALKVPMEGEMAAIPDDQQATPIPCDPRWDDHEVATLMLMLLRGSPAPTDLDAHDDGLLGSLDVVGAIWPDEHDTDLQTGGHATGLPADEFTDEMVVQQLALLTEVVEQPGPLRLPLPPGSQQQQLQQQQKEAAAVMEPAPVSSKVVGNVWKRLKICVTDNPVVVEEEPEVVQMVPGTELHPEEEHWGLLIREKTRGC